MLYWQLFVFNLALDALVVDIARLLDSCLIVYQTRITCSFLKREQQRLAQPIDWTVRSNHLAAMQFRHRVWSRLDANATRHDAMGRVATLQLNRSIRNEFPISRPFPFSSSSRTRIYVSIPHIRSGDDSENGGGRAEGESSGYLEFEAGPRFVWREARPTYPIRFHHWVGSFPGCQYLQYLTKLIQL